MNTYLLRLVACLSLYVSLNSFGALIDHGTFTRDTSTGLDWLDVSETVGLSHADIDYETSANGQYFGWSLATSELVGSFYDSFGAVSPYNLSNYWQIQTDNSGIYNDYVPNIQNLWGITRTLYQTDSGWVDQTFFRIQDGPTGNAAYMLNYENSSLNDFLPTGGVSMSYTDSSVFAGFALVRPSPVPLPAGIYLFVSGLVGLGLMRGRNA